MNLTSYLHKRDHSQNWQLRWMVPKAARAALGRSEFTKSLRVSNQSAAEALAYAQLTEWKRQVEAVLNATPPVQVADVTQPPRSAREIEDAAVSVGYEIASERASRLIAARSASSTAYSALYEKFDAWHRRSVRDLNGGALGYWRERARKQYKARGWVLDEGSAEFALFVRTMAQAGIDTFAKAKARMEGQEDRYQPSLLVDKTIAARQRQTKAGETILGLFENYAAQRFAERRKRTDTINQDRKVIELFVEYIGEDRSLSSIDVIEVREWRNAIAALPPAFRKHNANAGLSLREAADKARAAGVKGISASTVNKYLSTVSPLFDWAKQEGYVDRNPCDGPFYDLQKGKSVATVKRYCAALAA